MADPFDRGPREKAFLFQALPSFTRGALEFRVIPMGLAQHGRDVIGASKVGGLRRTVVLGFVRDPVQKDEQKASKLLRVKGGDLPRRDRSQRLEKGGHRGRISAGKAPPE